MTQELAAKTKQLDEAISTLKVLEQRELQMVQELGAKGAEVEELSQTLALQQQENVKHKTELDELHTEAQQHVSRAESSEQRVGELEAEAQQHVSRAAISEQRIGELETEAQQHLSRAASSEQRVGELEAEVQQHSSRAELSEHRIRELEAEAQQHFSRATSSEQRVGELEAEASLRAHEFDDLVARVEDQEHRIQRQDLELQERCEDLTVMGERLSQEKQHADTLGHELAASKEAHVSCRHELEKEKVHASEEAKRATALAEEIEELSSYTCGSTSEELSVQNRELVLTVHQFKQESELLEAEGQSLRKRLAIFEENLDRVTGQNAQLMGHANHRQKIHHTMQLKEELCQLHMKLRKAHDRIVRLQVDKWGGDFLEALASLCRHGEALGSLCRSGQQANHGGGGAGHSAVHSEAELQLLRPPSRATSEKGSPGHLCASTVQAQTSKTPEAKVSPQKRPEPRLKIQRTPSNPQLRQANAVKGATDANALQQQLRVVERRCFLQKKAFERVSVDFMHFVALLERTVFLADGGRVRVTSNGDGGVPLPVLMQRLRDLILDVQKQHQQCRQVTTGCDEAQGNMDATEFVAMLEDGQSSDVKESSVPASLD